MLSTRDKRGLSKNSPRSHSYCATNEENVQAARIEKKFVLYKLYSISRVWEQVTCYIIFLHGKQKNKISGNKGKVRTRDRTDKQICYFRRNKGIRCFKNFKLDYKWLKKQKKKLSSFKTFLRKQLNLQNEVSENTFIQMIVWIWRNYNNAVECGDSQIKFISLII